MKEKSLSIKQNMIWNFAGTVVYLGLQWLVTVMVVRLTGNYENAGILSLSISFSNMFLTIANFGIRSFQVSDIEDKYSPYTYLSSRFITCAGTLILCIAFALINTRYTIIQMGCIIFYTVFRLSEALVDVFQAIEQKAWRMDYIGKSFILRGVASFFAFCFVLYFSQNLLLAICAMAAATFLIVLLYDYNVARRLTSLKDKFSSKKIKPIFLECWPLMLNGLFLTAIVSISRYVLEIVMGSEQLGYYASVATPTVIVQTACTLIFAPLITLFAQAYNKKNKTAFTALLKKITLVLAGISASAIIVAYFAGDWGLQFLFGKEILPFAYLLIPIIVTTIMVAVTYFLDSLLTVFRQLKGMMVSSGISVLLVVIISPVLISKFGMQGINYSLYISFMVNIFIHIVLLYKAYKNSF